MKAIDHAIASFENFAIDYHKKVISKHQDISYHVDFDPMARKRREREITYRTQKLNKLLDREGY